MLYGVKQGYVLPWQVPANEFYNLQGGKFSTSESRTIPLDDFFARFDAEAARFYLLASAPETADSDWRWEDFQSCVNAQLADKIGNLVTRVLRFLEKNYGARIPAVAADGQLVVTVDRRHQLWRFHHGPVRNVVGGNGQEQGGRRVGRQMQLVAV